MTYSNKGYGQERDRHDGEIPHRNSFSLHILGHTKPGHAIALGSLMKGL